MTCDVLLVGQGLAGSFLGKELMAAGFSIQLIDDAAPNSASRRASGIINPVTGRRIVRTWEIDRILPQAIAQYQALETAWGIPLARALRILDWYNTPQMKLAFAERLPLEEKYLSVPSDEKAWERFFHPALAMGQIAPAWLIDVHALLDHARKEFLSHGCLRAERFQRKDLVLQDDGIRYQDIHAQKIIFCDGVSGFDDPLFHLLPYARNKGEALLLSIPGLPRQAIYKKGISLVPWQADLFWVGSTYQWDHSDLSPSALFRQQTERQLKEWLKLPFAILEHWAAERPANLERRPFVGLHPLYPQVGLFNGLGTKGCSLAPYFARAFAAFLREGTPLDPAVSLDRFTRILSRG